MNLTIEKLRKMIIQEIKVVKEQAPVNEVDDMEKAVMQTAMKGAEAAIEEIGPVIEKGLDNIWGAIQKVAAGDKKKEAEYKDLLLDTIPAKIETWK